MEPKPTYPSSSSQVTRYQPPIQDLPALAALGYGLGMAASAIPPLIREGWKGAVRTNALHSGRTSAAWMGLYCLFCNTLPYLRKKEDDWNGMIAFGLASGPAYRHTGILGMTQMMIVAGAAHGLANFALHRAGYLENKEAESIESGSKETQKES